MAITYTVKRSTSPGGPYSTIATGISGTTYSDTGLTASTPYYYVVVAVDSGSSSPNSLEATATTLAAGLPTAPTIGTATAGDTTATVTWSTPSSNGGSAITGYIITPYIAGVAQSTTTVGVVLTKKVTGLVNGSAYTFKVAAINSAGTGPQSAASNSVTPVAFSLTTYGSALKLWVDPSVWGLADNTAITTVTESGTNGLTFTGHTLDATNPLLKTNIINGHQVIRLAGGGNRNWLTGSAVVSTAVDNFAIFVVGTSGTAVGTTSYASSNAADGAWFRPSGNAANKVAAGYYSKVSMDSAVDPPAGFSIQVLRRVAGTSNLYLNGSPSIATSGIAPDTATGVPQIGADAYGAYFTGDVAMVIQIDQALTDSQLNQIGSYLATRFALTWTDL